MAQDKPIQMEPGKDYLGVICAHCGRSVAMLGPLDPAQISPDQPFTLGARGPLQVACPHCAHSAEYPVDQVRRIRGKAET